jgi:hypothetical protein
MCLTGVGVNVAIVADACEHVSREAIHEDQQRHINLD